MIQVIVLILTIFTGWLIFDIVKHKILKKENVVAALISAIIAGGVYYLLFVLI